MSRHIKTKCVRESAPSTRCQLYVVARKFASIVAFSVSALPQLDLALFHHTLITSLVTCDSLCIEMQLNQRKKKCSFLTNAFGQKYKVVLFCNCNSPCVEMQLDTVFNLLSLTEAVSVQRILQALYRYVIIYTCYPIALS